jgi:endonuclease/exonuclease/phosphatase family metal-dependent hydrolase
MLAVATWTLENLYRPGGAFGPKTQALYDDKLDQLAATITSIAPDVLAVQEVGQPAALADLVARLPGDWHTLLSAAPDVRGIRVGFVSRLAFTDHEDIVDLPAGLTPPQVDDSGGVSAHMGRGALRVTVNSPNGLAVQIVTVHLKSKLLSYPGGRFSPHDEDERARFGAYALYRRTAEATTVRCAVNARLEGHGQDRAVIGLGDMNDTPDAATSQILIGPGESELGTPGADRPDRGDGSRMWNLAPLLPAGEQYSRIHQGHGELIDLIYVSHRLHQHVTEMRSLVERNLPSIGDDPARRRNSADSDHAPVYARFDA